MKKRFPTTWIAGIAWFALIALGITLAQAQSAAQTPKGKTSAKTAKKMIAASKSINDPTNPAVVETEEGLRLNFHGVPLDTVLDYLSKAAGFIIIRNVDVSGTVDVWSHQPLTKDEAADLLDTILHEKGFAAIHNGRTLTIVTREEAKKRDIPVRTGNNPEQIPKNDSMVTQVIPIRYANAVKLIDDLKPLLPTYSQMTANESSNAVVLTDTQANIRRMTEIIKALDTSISNISSVKVFALKHADATEIAKVINDIYQTSSSSGSSSSRGGGGGQNNNRFRQMPPMFGGMGPGGMGPGGMGPGQQQSSSSEQSEARLAASRVMAVADQNTNSLVVSAPDELMPSIQMLVKEIDTATEDLTELRVFHLKYADAEDTAQILTDLFPQQTTQSNQRSNRGNLPGMMFGGPQFMGGGTGRNSQQQQNSERKVKTETVLAVADIRTQSVVVSAAGEIMIQIEKVIEKLDANPAKDRKVYIYKLEYGDVDNVATILQDMFENQNSSGSSRYGSSSNRNSSTTRNNQSSRNQNSNSSQSNRGSSSSNSGFSLP